MASYTATILWERGPDEVFTDNRYGRGHQWSFDGGVSFRASSSPHVVPRYSDPAGVDPEEAFIASLSSCHMLTFLYLAAKKGLTVNRYEDVAEGRMAKTPEGRVWVSEVVLHPVIVWEGETPDAETLDALHHAAHDECFIANSVRTDVRCEPRA
ncbi:OsmC family protein [Rhizobium sp. SG2393]|uniref:OsmC family protein n=1 Tax=Rhizobium sp. SG2393 TaxID=3276279 RepID=UPI00366CCB7A